MLKEEAWYNRFINLLNLVGFLDDKKSGTLFTIVKRKKNKYG